MLPQKYKNNPSLATITEIFDLEELTIVKPSKYEGIIRRQSEYFSGWKQKIFSIIFVLDPELTMRIIDKKSGKEEENVNLMFAKISKKCTEVDNQICFGLVLPNNQKYLVAFNSARQCMRIHAELVSAKKIMKNSVMISRRQELNQNIIIQIAEQQNQPITRFTPSSKPLQLTSNMKSNLKLYEQQFEKYVCGLVSQRKTSNYSERQKIIMSDLSTKSNQVNYFIAKQLEYQKMFQNDVQENRGIQYEQPVRRHGMKVIKELSHGAIYGNSAGIVRGTLFLSIDIAVRDIIELFYRFELWNSRINQLKFIAEIEEGKYLGFLEISKKSCFSSSRYSYVIVSIHKNYNGYLLLIRSLRHIPALTKKNNWIEMNLSAQVAIHKQDQTKKFLNIFLTSKDDYNGQIEFMQEIIQFKHLLQSKSASNTRKYSKKQN